jgi:hypothetical protein
MIDEVEAKWGARYYRYRHVWTTCFDTLTEAVFFLANGMDYAELVADAVIAPDGEELTGDELTDARWSLVSDSTVSDGFGQWITENKPEWGKYLDDRP